MRTTKLLLGAAPALIASSLFVARVSAEQGLARIKGTSENSPISGTVSFEETKQGLKVTAKLAGVPPGEHGFHIHELGSCEDSGKAAAGHYNPLKSLHGLVHKAGVKKAHAGDMGNITADAEGKAFLEVTLPKKIGLLRGRYNVAGRAVILHEKVDDFTQPLGNAGGRIGCGVIKISGL